MTKLFAWNKAKQAAFLIVLGCQSPAHGGSEFQYFGSDIDYWHEKRVKAETPPSTDNKELQTAPKPPQETSTDQGGFPWQKYLDPKNKEFFKEGEYTPPEPFMEIVRNPSDSNIKMWFSYIDKKNELSRKLQERMQEYMVKNNVQQGEASTSMKGKLAALPITAPHAKRFRFRMYFDSHCPHCKKMFVTLLDLQARGFYVEAKQIDSAPVGMEAANVPVSLAAPGEVQQKDIQSVPVLLIGDLEKKSVYRLTGYQTIEKIFSAIAQSTSK